MKYRLKILFSSSFILPLYFLFAFGFSLFPSSCSAQSIQTFQPYPGISIRALEVFNDSTVWFAANHGVYGYTENGGKTWKIDSLVYGKIQPEFRSIAVLNDSSVLLLSISSPALLYRTTNKGKNWKLVYSNDQKDIFFDCMKFWDAKHGMAIADPIDGKIQVITTKDGGKTWKINTKSKFPEMEKGEAFFASSNSNMVFQNQHSWIATGGKKSGVFYSPNGGKFHIVQNTPLPEGEEMTGIYSIDFYDEKLGVVAGGIYDKADTSIISLAITGNSGKNWNAIKLDKPVFGSCAQFLNENEILLTGSPGTFHYSIKENTLNELLNSENQSIGFHTLRISTSRKTLWLAGKNGSIGKLTFD